MNDIALVRELSITPLNNFFLGRQPIFDRKQNLFAYELLFRRGPCGPAMVVDDLSATATVIVHAAELGMERVIGQSKGLINVDTSVLLSDLVKILPRDKILLEVLESVQATEDVLLVIKDLAGNGFTIALDDVVDYGENVQKLLPLAEIVKLDISLLDKAQIASLTQQFKQSNKKLIAEKVEDQEQYEYCHSLGIDYFQGYFFAKPMVLAGKKIAPSEMAVLEVLNLLQTDAENSEIEAAIKHHVSLGLNLLRLVNTPAVGCSQRINSLSQALMLLGRRHLQRWLQILLYAKPNRDGVCSQALLTLASTRGKLLELIANKLHPNQRTIADTAFTVGIMSLMDSLFGVPMREILQQLNVADEVSCALLEREGMYGHWLKLAESIEHIEDSCPVLVGLLDQLHLSETDFYLLELDAFDWADKLAVGCL